MIIRTREGHTLEKVLNYDSYLVADGLDTKVVHHPLLIEYFINGKAVSERDYESALIAAHKDPDFPGGCTCIVPLRVHETQGRLACGRCAGWISKE